MYTCSSRASRIRASAFFLVSTLILVFYPASLRQSLLGELLTIGVGGLLLFAQVRAIDAAISRAPATFFEDFIDDLTAIYRRLKARTGFLAVFYTLFEKGVSWLFLRSLLRWLNPRLHPWGVVLLIGIVVGLLLALAEGFSGGGNPGPAGRFATVMLLFVSIECYAVLVGYALFAQPLGLLRRVSAAPECKQANV
ncbi:MAG TPA: hypothetical protein VGD98_00855 [Ktedonobacteraceae bacterium]